jgi:hypothetical protein
MWDISIGVSGTSVIGVDTPPVAPSAGLGPTLVAGRAIDAPTLHARSDSADPIDRSLHPSILSKVPNPSRKGSSIQSDRSPCCCGPGRNEVAAFRSPSVYFCSKVRRSTKRSPFPPFTPGEHGAFPRWSPKATVAASAGSALCGGAGDRFGDGNVCDRELRTPVVIPSRRSRRSRCPFGEPSRCGPAFAVDPHRGLAAGLLLVPRQLLHPRWERGAGGSSGLDSPRELGRLRGPSGDKSAGSKANFLSDSFLDSPSAARFVSTTRQTTPGSESARTYLQSRNFSRSRYTAREPRTRHQ